MVGHQKDENNQPWWRGAIYHIKRDR